MWTLRHQLCAASALLMAGCQQSGVDVSQSLVGAKKLPSTDTLEHEVIQITRSFGSTPSSLLSYELRPDNTLTNRLTRRDRDSLKAIADEKETFNLPSSIASNARRELWRLRPETLQGIEEIVRPADCPRPPVDTSPETAVAFIAEGPGPGPEDDRVGVVDVPAQYSCDTGHAKAARQVVKRVLESFPRSKAAAGFDRSRTE
jgi:hypothetical protein